MLILGFFTSLPYVQNLDPSTIHRHTEVEKNVEQVGKVGKVPFSVGFCAGFELDQVGKVQPGNFVGCGQVFEVPPIRRCCLREGGPKRQRVDG